MLALLSILLVAQPSAPPPGPIPGNCAAPARENQGRVGCYLAAELRLSDPPAEIHWHLLRFPDEAAARAEAGRHANSVVAFSHSGVWLHVLSPDAVLSTGGGEAVATAGPMRLDPGRPVIARFLESIFPPGMMTRPHRHAGPEAFYVLDGVQCMETAAERRMVRAGETYQLPAGVAHLQASPNGRRNMALVFHPADAAWMSIVTDWHGTGFCPGSE